jgi:hypothetical protein
VDDPHDGAYAPEPQLDDLTRLGRALNAHQVLYVLIRGFGVIAHGGARTTKDIDLLIEAGRAASAAGLSRRLGSR